MVIGFLRLIFKESDFCFHFVSWCEPAEAANLQNQSCLFFIDKDILKGIKSHASVLLAVNVPD